MFLGPWSLEARGKAPKYPMPSVKSGPDNNILVNKIKNNSGRDSKGGDAITVWHSTGFSIYFYEFCFFIIITITKLNQYSQFNVIHVL